MQWAAGYLRMAILNLCIIIYNHMTGNHMALFNFNDVNLAVNYFYNIIYDYFDIWFKRNRIPKNGIKYPKWFSREIVSDIKVIFFRPEAFQFKIALSDVLCYILVFFL